MSDQRSRPGSTVLRRSTALSVIALAALAATGCDEPTKATSTGGHFAPPATAAAAASTRARAVCSTAIQHLLAIGHERTFGSPSFARRGLADGSTASGALLRAAALELEGAVGAADAARTLRAAAEGFAALGAAVKRTETSHGVERLPSDAQYRTYTRLTQLAEGCTSQLRT